MIRETKKTYEKIGTISVDSGLVLIGDPCYFLHNQKPASMGKNWKEFCTEIENNQHHEFWHDIGRPGAAITASTGYGDGEYDVMAEKINGRISKITITFIEA